MESKTIYEVVNKEYNITKTNFGEYLYTLKSLDDCPMEQPCVFVKSDGKIEIEFSYDFLFQVLSDLMWDEYASFVRPDKDDENRTVFILEEKDFSTFRFKFDLQDVAQGRGLEAGLKCLLKQIERSQMKK